MTDLFSTIIFANAEANEDVFLGGSEEFIYENDNVSLADENLDENSPKTTAVGASSQLSISSRPFSNEHGISNGSIKFPRS